MPGTKPTPSFPKNAQGIGACPPFVPQLSEDGRIHERRLSILTQRLRRQIGGSFRNLILLAHTGRRWTPIPAGPLGRRAADICFGRAAAPLAQTEPLSVRGQAKLRTRTHGGECHLLRAPFPPIIAARNVFLIPEPALVVKNSPKSINRVDNLQILYMNSQPAKA